MNLLDWNTSGTFLWPAVVPHFRSVCSSEVNNPCLTLIITGKVSLCIFPLVAIQQQCAEARLMHLFSIHTCNRAHVRNLTSTSTVTC